MAPYNEFIEPIRSGDRPSFDVHVYFHQDNELESHFAQSLRQEIIQEFPDLPMFKMHRTPVGPHTVGMFEVDVFMPAQLGALMGWLTTHHGPLSILVHPHTGDELKDHTQNAIWIGERLPLNLDVLRKSRDMDEVAKRLGQLTANQNWSKDIKDVVRRDEGCGQKG